MSASRCAASSALTYVVSGTLSALAGLLFASRLGGAGADTGVGLEIAALTAAVLGGNSLGGGRGSAAKAIIGSIIVMIMVNGLVRLGVTSGAQLAAARHWSCSRRSRSTCAG